jgi:hypothetical protein
MAWTKFTLKKMLVSAGILGCLLAGSATFARAADVEKCRRNVDKWEDRLNRDIERHGYSSRQANHDRHELDEARDSCRRQYGDYGSHGDDFDHGGDRR